MSNRRMQLEAGDPQGLLWRFKAAFAPAGLTERVLPVADAGGKPGEALTWGAGEATVEYFPAFAEPAADGLLIRVTLTNRSAAPETFYVDLLGGMFSLSDHFLPQQLAVLQDPDTHDLIVQHARCDTVFVLKARTPLSPHATAPGVYKVNDAYFSAAEAHSAIPDIPTGVLPFDEEKGDKERDPRRGNSGGPLADKNLNGPKGDNAGDAAKETGDWGLTRLDDIALAPGESTTVTLCVGVGKDAKTAEESADTLLGAALEVTPDALAGTPAREIIYPKAVEAHQAALLVTGDAALDRLMQQSFANVPFGQLRRVGVPSRRQVRGQAASLYQPEAGGMIALGWALARPDWAAAQLNAWFLTSTGEANAPITHPQAVAPTNLFALWELYQRTQDRQMLARFYPFARRRYLEMLTVGRLKEGDWLFGWPEPVAAGGATVGEERSNSAPRFAAPDYCAYVIRSAKIMLRMAEQTGQPAEDLLRYTADARDAAHALNAELWDANSRRYMAKSLMKPSTAALSDAMPVSADSLRCLLPLFAGPDTQTPEQRQALLKALTDPATFWSAAGLRSVSKSSLAYDPEGRESGGIDFGMNWMLWKALLDQGEPDIAHALAENLLQGYRNAGNPAGICPEWLDGDTGAARGVTDYSGDACALIALYAAYHIPGTVSAGWELDLHQQSYDKAADTLHLKFKTLANRQGKHSLVCVLGKPNGKYRLSGALTEPVTADGNGVLTLSVPEDKSVRDLDITPLSGGN